VEIISEERFGRQRLMTAIKNTRLLGLGGARPYEQANLMLSAAVDPATLAPAQNYVLRSGIEKVLELRAALLLRAIDIFALDGGVYIRTSDDPSEIIPVIPPIVEDSSEPDGKTVQIINDGIHRIFAARSMGLPISVITITNVPSWCPYYAFALRDGWPDVAVLDDLPTCYQKKKYRDPHNYKAVFRNFNEQFPGVQKKRKSSNPAHLKE